MHTNQLIHESSPYLLQHAHNPVNWQAWNEKSLQIAKEQNKLILVSVGYSACHWCHVMERESFEDEEVAGIMNANFINIKVDREERPDVDQVYMQAVQVMTGTGGWPMNVICLPDGRPVWGGTYLQKSHWMQVLQQVAQLYEKNPGKMLDYAGRLKEGLDSLELIKTPREDSSFQKEVLKNIVAKLKKDFDLENGGFKGAPKFMMPGALSFLMRYGFQENQTQILDFVNLSLEKMARGGLYDVVGGGFSRYSVDKFWHVPHFEKMLYDNAQLIRLYAQAWKLDQNPLYKKVVYQSLEFIEEELSEASGGFYSALDADSPDENNKEEEGAYYIWSKAELEKLLGDDIKIFADYFNINSFGKWEEKYVFIQTQTEEKIAENHGLSLEELQKKITDNLQLLKKERAKRQKPGLDDKSLCSWNALMLTGLIEAYKAFNEIQFLERARSSAEFVKNQFLKNDYSLWHSYKAGKSSIEGFLEDYAFCIEAFLEMYEVTFQPEYLELAQKLTKKCIEDFSDDKTGLFWFTSKQQASLINKTRELTDNVIPASNSVMAHNLFKLGKHLDSSEYSDRAEKMLKTVQDQFKTYPRGYYNWLDLMLNFTNPFYEIAILGPNALILGQQFQKKYLPNTLFAGSTESSKLPLLNYRFEENNDLIYVCEKGSCQLPNSTVEDSIDKIKQF